MILHRGSANLPACIPSSLPRIDTSTSTNLKLRIINTIQADTIDVPKPCLFAKACERRLQKNCASNLTYKLKWSATIDSIPTFLRFFLIFDFLVSDIKKTETAARLVVQNASTGSATSLAQAGYMHHGEAFERSHQSLLSWECFLWPRMAAFWPW